jgi:hypothetical protein
MMSRGKYWVTEPDQEATINMNVPGYGVKPAKTVISVFHETVNKYGNEKAMALKRPIKVSYIVMFLRFKVFLTLFCVFVGCCSS